MIKKYFRDGELVGFEYRHDQMNKHSKIGVEVKIGEKTDDVQIDKGNKQLDVLKLSKEIRKDKDEKLQDNVPQVQE